MQKLKRLSSYADQTNARAWLWKYVEKNGLAGFSLRRAAIFLETKIGTRPADGTVAAYMREKYEYQGGGWIRK